MLTNDFKQNIQNQPSTQPNQPMNDQQFNSWLSESSSAPAKDPTFTDRIGGDFMKRGQDVVNDVTAASKVTPSKSGFDTGVNQATKTVEAGLRTAGNVAGGAMDILGEAGKSLFNILPSGVKDAINTKVQTAGDSFLKDTNILGQTNQETLQHIANLAQKHPEATKDLVAGLNIASILGLNTAELKATGGKGLPRVALDEAKALPEQIQSGVQSTVQGVKSLVTKPVQTIKGLINGKTTEEILATPEADVHKLSAPERQVYFDNQQEQVSNARTLADQKVKADLEVKSSASQAKAEELNKQLATASRDEVVSLRPKIRSAMAEQSAHYRSLVDEAIQPYKDTPVKAKELSSFVDSKYTENPGMADAIREKLGLNEKTTTPLLGKSGKFEVPTGDTTLGKLYEQAKALKQDISSGASKGTKVFTPDDKLTDDAISTLSEYMKKNGVDLSEANKFWSRYAPVRNQLVSEAKPFLQAPVNTKTFANTLTRIAKGTDVNNENFIGAVEDLVGQPLATEQKSIVAQLGENEKQQIANEFAAQEQKLNNKLTADLASKKITEKAFEASRLAGRRNIIKNILKTGATVFGAGEVIKHSPF